jgi:hypothetical protein
MLVRSTFTSTSSVMYVSASSTGSAATSPSAHAARACSARDAAHGSWCAVAALSPGVSSERSSRGGKCAHHVQVALDHAHPRAAQPPAERMVRGQQVGRQRGQPAQRPAAARPRARTRAPTWYVE